MVHIVFILLIHMLFLYSSIIRFILFRVGGAGVLSSGGCAGNEFDLVILGQLSWPVP